MRERVVKEKVDNGGYGDWLKGGLESDGEKQERVRESRVKRKKKNVQNGFLGLNLK